MNAFREIGNLILRLLPVSGCFGLKRGVLRAMGVDVQPGALVNGHTLFYGRGQVRIGRNTWVGPGCRFHATAGTTIDIGDECDIAPEVAFVTGTHDIGPEKRRAGKGRAGSISIGAGSWLGVRATIMGGVSIGRGSIVAACALVRAGLPENSFAAGVPAVVKRSLTADS
jgi:maltose O-acetyltransferase